MKNLFFILFATLTLISCEKPSECVESFGKTIVKDIPVQPFLKITVYNGIEVVISQGEEYKVQIEAGENFIDNIEVIQTETNLEFKDNTSCNWVREYGKTKVLITAPNLEDIYSKTERKISSNGVLTYPTIRLYAFDKDGDGLDGAGTGDFFFNVDNSQLVIQGNNVANFYIEGKTNQALMSLYFGDGRIEAQNLEAKHIIVFHRSTNDMILNPIEKIEGKMLSLGNVFLKNNPPDNTLESHYTGQIIYN